MESYITDTEIVEGLCASVVWSLFFVNMRKRLHWPTWIEGGLAWMLVWVVRKFGITIYKSIKKKQNWASFKIQLLPFPKYIKEHHEI